MCPADTPDPSELEKGSFDPKSLIRKMRQDYWKALEQSPSKESEEIVALLMFVIGRERFGFHVLGVREVTLVPENVARVPRGGSIFYGVMNLRGQILPILDFRNLVGAPIQTPGPAARVIVLRGEEGDLGLLAEDIIGMREMPKEQLIAPLDVETNVPSALVSAQINIDKRIAMVLDHEAMMNLEILTGLS